MAYYSRVDFTTGTITHGQLQFFFASSGDSHVPCSGVRTRPNSWGFTIRIARVLSSASSRRMSPRQPLSRTSSQGLPRHGWTPRRCGLPLTVHDDVLGNTPGARTQQPRYTVPRRESDDFPWSFSIVTPQAGVVASITHRCTRKHRLIIFGNGDVQSFRHPQRARQFRRPLRKTSMVGRPVQWPPV